VAKNRPTVRRLDAENTDCFLEQSVVAEILSDMDVDVTVGCGWCEWKVESVVVAKMNGQAKGQSDVSHC